MSNTSDRAELRELLARLKAAAGRLDALLADGRRLPAVPLAKVTLDIDRAAGRLEKHAAKLAAAGGSAEGG